MDPATWSWLTCTWLIQTSIGGILGNRIDASATDIWTQGWQGFTQKMRGDHTTPLNQDLEIATHRAFLLAQWSLVCDCLSEFTGGTWTPLGARQVTVRTGYTVLPQYAEQDVDWLQAQLRKIQTNLKRLQKGNYIEMPSKAFDTSMEMLLSERGMVAEDAESLLRKELAESMLTGKMPERYKERATATEKGLFERTSAFFAFELKTNPAVQSLFQNHLLLQMNVRLQDLSVQPIALEALEVQLKDVANQLPDILASLDNLEIAVRELGKGVEEVAWLVANRTDDLIAFAVSHADDLAELKRLVSDMHRQLQTRFPKPISVIELDGSASMPRTGINPFIYGPAVPPECFYGRKEQLAHIKQRIGGRAPQCVNVVGLRRNGKSSVLRYVKERISEFCLSEQKPIVVSLDLQDKRFHQPIGITEGLRRNIEKKIGKTPWTKADNNDLFEIEDGLEALLEQGYRLIVMFDEFEAIGQRLEVFQDWGDDWRSKASRGLVTLVVASRQEVSKLYQKLNLTSPFGNIFSTAILGELEAGTWQKLLIDGGLEEIEIQWVYETAGKLPYYTQLAAAMIWQHGKSSQAKQHFLAQASMRFEELYQELSHTDLLALKNVSTATLPPIDSSKIHFLEAHGLVQSNGRLFSHEFATFVEKKL